MRPLVFLYVRITKMPTIEKRSATTIIENKTQNDLGTTALHSSNASGGGTAGGVLGVLGGQLAIRAVISGRHLRAN